MQSRYSYIFFDTCFFARLYRIDRSCNLFEYFTFLDDDAKYVVDRSQFSKTYYTHTSMRLLFLDQLITDEELILKSWSFEKIDSDISQIFRDPVDVKIFIWAIGNDDVLILTCDQTLLLVCKKYNINRSCFKNAIMMLDRLFCGTILNDNSWDIDLMQYGDDPFFHFNTNLRCISHCGPSSICVTYET